MPIYEYECRACAHRFEAIVRASDTPKCPSCEGQDLERLISLFAVDSDGTRKNSISSAQQKNARTTREKNHADFEYDRKHRHE